MSSWETKIWGKTKCLIESPFYSKHELEVKRGGICSFHYHTKRSNRFRVMSGIVKIVWAFGKKINSCVLKEGESKDISSLIPHQFQVIESGIMFEEYFSDRGGEISNRDIVRLTEGCKLSSIMYQQNNDIIFNCDGSSYF